ncbi:hypothetical protein GSI_03523 [Ganoderma sinense ZZ0214-1]|uniref:Uncharacterized protein n=1 Tax=Ganoderma sinense ZZ0214-1 TaxID=1077348 RepID=A0A2G8SLV7_9APHY|nr:hypothetical protein GSI_03523 [Ganoderma sinense ZZ0214-1]
MLQRPARLAPNSESEADSASSSSAAASNCLSTTASSTGGSGVEMSLARAYLIDFDWAGKEGEARYPVDPTLNPDVEWPRPVSELPGQLITKDDDLFMLEGLLGDRLGDATAKVGDTTSSELALALALVLALSIAPSGCPCPSTMLDPHPPQAPIHSTPTIVPFVMNIHPFYETIELGSGDFDSVTAILEKGRRWMQVPRRGYYDHWGPSLRWITDKSTAFVRKDDSDVSSLREDAKAWYCNKGRCLTSEPVDTDDTLWKRLHRGSASIATGELEIQLYLVAPATRPTKVRFDTGVHAEQIRRMYILDYEPVSEELWYPDSDGSDTDKDNSILTRMAALYEPTFAYAQNALQRGLQDVPLSDSGGNHEEEGNAGSVVAAGDAMVCDAIGEDDVLDTHLFMAQLRDALNGLKAGCPDSESKESASAHGVALPVNLSLLERVTRGQNSYVFTGTLTLPALVMLRLWKTASRALKPSKPATGLSWARALRAGYPGLQGLKPGPAHHYPARHGTDDSAQSSEPELPVHVKFVEEYSVAAHRLLAAHTDPTSGAPCPLAPQLYWAGEVDVVPGLWMTVMETLARWDADMPEDGVDGSEDFALPESPRVLGGGV